MVVALSYPQESDMTKDTAVPVSLLRDVFVESSKRIRLTAWKLHDKVKI